MEGEEVESPPSAARSKVGYVENAMLLGLTVLHLDLSLERSTTLVVVATAAAAALMLAAVVAVLVVVGEAMFDPPEELLLWLEMDMGDTKSLDPPEPVSDDSSPRQPRPSLLRRAILAGMHPVGEPTDSSDPVGDPRLLTDMGDVGSVGFASDMVALMGRLMAPVLVCV